jgi:sec-independent protein translocase protein TatB
MFDIGIGFSELALIGLVALVVLGPERLPKLARTGGLWLGKARRFLSDVKRDIDQEIKSSELDQLKDLGKELREAGDEFGTAVQDVQQGVEQSAQTLKEQAEKPELLEAIQNSADANATAASMTTSTPAEHGKAG